MKRLFAHIPLVSAVLLLIALPAGLWAAVVHPIPPAPPKTAPPPVVQMTTPQAILLGAVEGLTEYLPVSSTGHLLVTERILGIGNHATASPEEAEHNKAAADAYAVCIQIGAIVAVLGLYARRVRQMIRGLLGKDRTGLALFVNTATAFLPAAVIGLLFNKLIKAYLFGLWPVLVAWFLGGLAILLFSRRRDRANAPSSAGRALEQLNMRMALVIGFAQCIAMWPGVSRSLVTILAGMGVGLSLSASVEFSFLLGVVTLSAATGYDALKHGQEMLTAFSGTALVAGLVAAFLFAVISVKWMVSYLNRHSMAVFGYYRIAIALVVTALLTLGVI